MTSLTASEILARLGWVEISLPNSVLKVFMTPKDRHPDAWRMHKVNQYLFTMCLYPTVGGKDYKVMLGMRDCEIVQARW
jgi:hypothetical protein